MSSTLLSKFEEEEGLKVYQMLGMIFIPDRNGAGRLDAKINGKSLRISSGDFLLIKPQMGDDSNLW